MEEADAVRDVILSNKVNYWTGGECREFEKEYASWVGVSHAVALANGTVALDVALKALGIGPGDEVIVTPRTFIASISCVVNAGAEPVFVDVEPDSGNLSAATIAGAITQRTKAVICVHLAGWPCDMDPIMALAETHNFFVIEDCAQAHGARYKGRSVGSIGHVGAWSFCQDKIMSTGGEGGMVTTNDESLWRSMWALKDHGKSYAAVYERDHPPGFRWVHESFGTNWRMLEMQAVIGRIQLRRMPEWHASRVRNAHTIQECARGLPGLRVADVPSGFRHAAYKLYVYIDPAFFTGINPDKFERKNSLPKAFDDPSASIMSTNCGADLTLGPSSVKIRDWVLQEIQNRGVPCAQGTCSEVYLEQAFEGTGWRPETCLPVANELGNSSLMFLVHPTLTASEIDMTCRTLSDVMRIACSR